jgi:hypothetical protein
MAEQVQVKIALKIMVLPTGIEPMASSLPGTRSTN